jgi:CubicO group peptidase (beta-lactamase class C family)
MPVSRRAVLGWGLAMVCLGNERAFARVPPTDGPLSDAEVGHLLRQHNVPGAGLAILDAGKIEAAYSYGISHETTSVSETTRFQAASISKTLNALVVLTLARDGLIGLDDPVNKSLKAFKLGGPNAERVTPRMLLSHTGGTSVRGFAGYEPGQPLPSLDQILSGQAPANSGAIKVIGELGRYAYSGGGVTVLQQLVIDVTDLPYANVASLRVLSPLSMVNSSFEQPPPTAQVNDYAHAHDTAGLPTPGDYNIYPELAAAGLWTTPSDLCRMMHAMAVSISGGRNAQLPLHIAQQMVTPVAGNAALGVFASEGGMISHGGRNRGFSALYRLSTSTGRGVAVMVNRHMADPILAELVERAFGHRT